MKNLWDKVKAHDPDRLVRHSLLLLFFAYFGGVANALFHVLMGQTLGRNGAEYGALVSMLGLALIVSTPLAAVSNTLAHFTGHLMREGRHTDLRRLTRRWLGGMFILTLPLALMALIATPWLTRFFHLASPWLTILTIGAMFVMGLTAVLNGVLQGGQAFLQLGIAGTAWGLLRLILGAALVFSVAPNAAGGLWAQLISTVIVFVLTMGLVSRLIPSDHHATGLPLERTDRYFFLSLLAQFAYALLMNADVVLVKIFFPDANDYGSYAKASTIARTIIFASTPVAGALFPKVISRGERSGAHARLLLKATGFTAAVIFSAVAVCLIAPRLPMIILYRDFAPSPAMIALVRGVALAMAPTGLICVLMTFETAQRRFGMVPWLAAGALGFILATVVWHPGLPQFIALLGFFSWLTLIGLLVVMLRAPLKSAASGILR